MQFILFFVWFYAISLKGMEDTKNFLFFDENEDKTISIVPPLKELCIKKVLCYLKSEKIDVAKALQKLPEEIVNSLISEVDKKQTILHGLCDVANDVGVVMNMNMSVALLTLSDQKLKGKREGKIRKVALSPDGSRVAIYEYDRNCHNCSVYDVNSGACLETSESAIDMCSSMHFNKNNDLYFLVNRNLIKSDNKNFEHSFIDSDVSDIVACLAGSKTLMIHRSFIKQKYEIIDDNDIVQHIIPLNSPAVFPHAVYSKDSNCEYLAIENRTNIKSVVQIWDIARKNPCVINRLSHPENILLESIGFNNDGTHVATGSAHPDHKVYLWDLKKPAAPLTVYTWQDKFPIIHLWWTDKLYVRDGTGTIGTIDVGLYVKLKGFIDKKNNSKKE